MPRTQSGRREEERGRRPWKHLSGQNQCRSAFLYLDVAAFYFDVTAHLSTRRLDPSPIRRASSSVVRFAGRANGWPHSGGAALSCSGGQMRAVG